jgi:hypothetical protein
MRNLEDFENKVHKKLSSFKEHRRKFNDLLFEYKMEYRPSFTNEN